MKIMILGGSGMLGHRLWIDLSRAHDVWVTVRTSASMMPDLPGMDRSRIRDYVDMLDFDNVMRAFASIQPELVINCIGLVKQNLLSNDPLSVIELNARLPHRVSLACRTAGARMVHISTDCVFSGRTGNYTEETPSDAEDLYGRSKFLGEVAYPHTITLRTSIIGRELRTRYGLTEWFLNQQQAVKGFKRAIFSGFTTQAISQILLDYVIPNASLSGVWQVASQPISKYDLLHLMKQAYRKKIEIQPEETTAVDRSLDGSRFNAATGFVAPAWPEMIQEMAASPLPYDKWKN
jgi:dTDP-4-dehydrorhamnose reductase